MMVNSKGCKQEAMSEATDVGHREMAGTNDGALKLVRFHLHDWVILFGLLILDRVLAKIHPFDRFVGEFTLDNVRYPHKRNTIPFWAVPIFNNVTGEVVCHGDRKAIEEGHRSFPSGHTSWCFAGLGFFSLYLAGKITVFDRKGHISKLVIVFSPLAVATFVGLSRVNDYKHHWQDVFTGALLGLTIATLCYRQFFPALHDDNSMHPYTIFPASDTENSSTANQQPPLHSPSSVNNAVADTEMGRIQHASDEWLGI